MSHYSILEAPTEDRYCAITKHPEAMRNTARPTLGESMGSCPPEILDFHMSKVMHPAGIQVPDVILNALDFLIVSSRFKDLLAEHAIGSIEYLPFRLLNHKGRIAAELCYVVNVLGAYPCGDRARSRGTDSPFDPGTFFSCERLALDVSQAPAEVNIFRATLFPPAIFVREDLRARIEEHDLSVRFVDLGELL